MKLLLPGGGGAGGIIRGWRLRGQSAKIFFFARGRWCRRHYQRVEVEGAGCKISFFCQGEVVQGALLGGGGEKGEEGAGCKTIFPIRSVFSNSI
jgi:hypothetical protein